MNQQSLSLSFFGISVSVNSTSHEILEWLSFDFSRFLSSSTLSQADVTVSIESSNTITLPQMVESSHAPEYILYKEGKYRWIDYYGRAVARFDAEANSCSFYSDEIPFLYEKVYLYILSRIGELLDTKGVHRVHALGFSYNGSGILYLIPMRGGKSTLGLKLRTYEACRLLSDDTPVIDNKGNLYPFPVRLGVIAGEVPSDIDSQYVRRFERSGKAAKDLIHADGVPGYWQELPVPCRAIIVGKWTTSATPSMRQISQVSTFKLLLRDCVIGYGLPQVVEFFLRNSIPDMFAKAKLVIKRSWAAFKLVQQAQCLELHVTQNHEKNLNILIGALQQIQGASEQGSPRVT